MEAGTIRRAYSYMKKYIQYIVVLSLLLTILLPTQISHAAGKTIVGVSTVYKETTGSAKFSVFIKTSQPVAAGSLELVYDSTKLSVSKNGVKQGDAFTTQISSVNSGNAGKIVTAWASDSAVRMDGELLSITGSVTAKGKGEHIKLQLKNVELYNVNGKKIATQVIDGAIKPFDGTKKTHSENVPVTKEWIVTLSVPVNDYSLNQHAVTVKRGSANVPIKIVTLSSTKFKVVPEKNYSRGKHTLEVSELVTSLNGNKLRKPVQLEFTVR